MTSIPFLFPVPGAANPISDLKSSDVAAGEVSDSPFASLLGAYGVEGEQVLDETAFQPILQSVAAQVLPADVQERIAALLEGDLPVTAEEIVAVLDQASEAGAEIPEELIASLGHPADLPQDEQSPEDGSDETQLIAAAAAAAPVPAYAATVTEAGSSERSPVPASQAAPQISPDVPGDQHPKTGEGAALAGTAGPETSDSDQIPSATATRDQTRAAASAAQAPSAGQVADAQLQATRTEGARVAAAATDDAEQPSEAGNEDTATERPSTKPTGVDRTGLERALERTAEHAQQRIEANIERRATHAIVKDGLIVDVEPTSDGADLGTLPSATDAARGVRLAALTGTNGQAHLPVAQLAVQIAAHARAGTNRFSIRLDPPELGKIDIRLEVSQDGSVASRLSVERPETLDMLLRDAKALERALNDAGLKTDDNSLRFSLKGEGFSQGREDGAPQRRNRRDSDQLAGIDAMNDGAALAEYRHFAASSALDIVV